MHKRLISSYANQRLGGEGMVLNSRSDNRHCNRLVHEQLEVLAIDRAVL